MKEQNDTRVTIRVDRDLKERAETLLERMGLNMSTAVNIFLRKTVDESAIPFPVSVKTSFIGYGLTVNDISKSFTAAVREDVAEYRDNGFPVAKYDGEKRKAYLEAPDGTREYINGYFQISTGPSKVYASC